VAVELLPELRKAAKERQVSAGGKNNSRAKKNGSANNCGTIDAGESRDQAAALVGVNRQYVSDAAKLKEDAPECRILMVAIC